MNIYSNSEVLINAGAAAVTAGNAVILPGKNFRRYSLTITSTGVTTGASVNILGRTSSVEAWVTITTKAVSTNGTLFHQFEGPWESVTVSMTPYTDGTHTVTILAQE